MTEQQPAFLYIEDNPTSRVVMEVLLKELLGYQHVTILDDSTDFMAKTEAIQPAPDLILLDIHMQPHDGFHILKALRAHERFQDKTIVAVTASVMNEEVELLKTAGFDGGIAKPIQQQTFPDLIGRLLKGEKVWHIR